jgi:hypothetical protein
MRALAPVALLLALSACATPRPPRPIAPDHTLVPGTRVALVVPDGMKYDPALPGFETADGRTALFVSELPGSVYTTMRNFSGEAFQKSGMELEAQENVTVDGWPARLYRARQPLRDDELTRLVLVFGDSSRSIIVTAVTPRSLADEHAETLRATLLSTRWHREGVAPTAAQ